MSRMTLRISMFALALSCSTASMASNLAIFGNNNIGAYYSSTGNSVTYVSDADLATTGFLNAFDAFVYTRNGYSFGDSLSGAAAANVAQYVTGNIVLFSGDFQDDIGDVDTNALFNNALNFITSGGHGYLGEFNGALAAYASNAGGYAPIGLINGAAGMLGGGLGGSNGNVEITDAGMSSPITAGVGFPYNPGAVEFGFDQSGYNSSKVVAQFSDGTPAIIASGAGEISDPTGAVPELSTWAMMLTGFGAVGVSLRRRKGNMGRAAAYG